MKRPRSPIFELILSRLREFWREPEALFWVYGFPILLIVALGLAFPDEAPRPVVDVASLPGHETAVAALRSGGDIDVLVNPLEVAKARHRSERTDLVVIPEGEGYVYLYDPSRPEDHLAKVMADSAIQRAKGRPDPVMTRGETVKLPGSRYIDWLLPGLVGMNIMGGGLWGVGFVLVDMRVRKLLKRFRATPMRRSDFLLAILGSRVVFMIPEVFTILLIGKLLFGAPLGGAPLLLALVILAGSICFCGLGLLLACRTERLETASGLTNLAMMPMWILSGIFFSAERFPDAIQPFVRALPLTQLNFALRGVILEGQGLADIAFPLVMLVGVGGIAFTLALRWFRWT